MVSSIFMKRRDKFILVLLFLMLPALIYSQKNSATNNNLLNNSWYISSSEKVVNGGASISTSDYSTGGWYPAFVPSTIMGVLVKNNVYKDIFLGDNLKKVPSGQFEKSWWYRNEFTVPAYNKDKIIKLQLDGIIYRANLWLNGKLIANSDSVKGVFRHFEFNISNVVKQGAGNVLAIEIFPPNPGELSLGFADWNPLPPDKCMGLWRDARVIAEHVVSIKYPYVQSKLDLNTLKHAELIVTAELVNNKQKEISGMLNCEIGNIKFSKKITLLGGETKKVSFTPEEFSQLKITNPEIWWPHDMGKQPLYNLELKFIADGKTTDICNKKFGIRKVSDYINAEGFRGYKFNGKRIQILGGGWTDNIFLHNEYNNLAAQVQYIKQMGLNTIRLEGFWGSNEDLYNLCDEYGILLMAGWSCQWENDEYIGKHVDEFGGIESADDINLIALSWEDQVKWLRNHPSIFLWLYGSDRTPRPELEKKYLKILKEYDTTRPVLASVAEYNSSVSGRTAVKMRGPYAYVPPVYWWSDKQKGGAFGFNTEQGSGAQVPPVESILKMFPKEHLWPMDSVWNYHCPTGTFNNMKDFNDALFSRVGKPGILEEYCTKAQFINYESTRAMYEAIEANKYVSTGAIHWMLNSAWPKLWWQLYDYYLTPGGAFYGVKKAREPLHIMYNYGDDAVMFVNNTSKSYKNITAKIRALNFDLTEKYSKEISLNPVADETSRILKMPVIEGLSKTYFMDLKLINNGKTISSNFYCLSTKPEILDTANALWYKTPAKEFADLTDLNKLEKVKLNIQHKFIISKETEQVEVVLFNNTSKLAFQVELSIQKGKNGESVVPIFWDDNYFSLLPGEKKIIKGHFAVKNLDATKPVLKVSGWNIISNAE